MSEHFYYMATVIKLGYLDTKLIK